MKENNSKRFNSLLIAIAATSIFFLFSVAIFYFYNFNGAAGDQEKFGQFGDFIGGVLNPIFSFLSVVLLISSIHLQRKELNNVVEELELTRNVHQSSFNMKHYEFILEESEKETSDFRGAIAFFKEFMEEKVTINTTSTDSQKLNSFTIHEIFRNTDLFRSALDNGYLSTSNMYPSKNTTKIESFAEHIKPLEYTLKTMIESLKQVRSLGCPKWRAKTMVGSGTDIIEDYFANSTSFKQNFRDAFPIYDEFHETFLKYPDNPKPTYIP